METIEHKAGIVLENRQITFTPQLQEEGFRDLIVPRVFDGCVVGLRSSDKRFAYLAHLPSIDQIVDAMSKGISELKALGATGLELDTANLWSCAPFNHTIEQRKLAIIAGYKHFLKHAPLATRLGVCFGLDVWNDCSIGMGGLVFDTQHGLIPANPDEIAVLTTSWRCQRLGRPFRSFRQVEQVIPLRPTINPILHLPARRAA